ncbi:hypothetical protein ACFVYA_43245 [Amycolatopsis sp. NPDC058278]|uniref:hypothetical protein n=1 Tax=Amycolatopsis sp. NPDC058278 TaxID=3346417 RepID=UPI0036DEF132
MASLPVKQRPAGTAAARTRHRPGRHGLPDDGRWAGAPYPAEQFRADAGLSPGAVLLGSGEVADTLWARSALTVLGIDCPPVLGSAAAVTPRARAG